MLDRRPPLATIAGLSGIAAGVALGAVAYAFYPWAFSPARNWLSDLGNVFLSPRGSIFFRADMVVVGVALAVFFLGLRAWSRGRRWWLQGLVGMAQLSGLVSAIALVMTGVFSEDQFRAHSVWASIMFIALAVAVWFVGWAAVAHPEFSLRVGAFAFAVCAAIVVSAAVRHYWLEWLAVAMLLSLVGVLSLLTSSPRLRLAPSEA